MSEKSESVGWAVLINNQLGTAGQSFATKQAAERILKNMQASGEFDGLALSLVLVKVTTELASVEDTQKYNEMIAQIEEVKRLSRQ